MPKFTYEDNEKFALAIVDSIRGKVINKEVATNERCFIVCLVDEGITNPMTIVESTVPTLIKGINPNCKISTDSDYAYSEPKGVLVPAIASTISFRDTYYDDVKNYYGTEVYISFADTPCGKMVAAITVSLENE